MHILKEKMLKESLELRKMTVSLLLSFIKIFKMEEILFGIHNKGRIRMIEFKVI